MSLLGQGSLAWPPYLLLFCFCFTVSTTSRPFFLQLRSWHLVLKNYSQLSQQPGFDELWIWILCIDIRNAVSVRAKWMYNHWPAAKSLITSLTLLVSRFPHLKQEGWWQHNLHGYFHCKTLSPLKYWSKSWEILLPCHLSDQQYISSSLQHNLRSFEGFCFCFEHMSIDVYWNPQAGRDLAHFGILAPLVASDGRCFCQQGLF